METAHVDQKSTYTIKTKDESTNHVEYLNTKSVTLQVEEVDKDLEPNRPKPPTTARDFVTEILLVEDDPTQNPWTFRMWFIGIGMSVFAG
jgi:hypothetical protein